MGVLPARMAFSAISRVRFVMAPLGRPAPFLLPPFAIAHYGIKPPPANLAGLRADLVKRLNAKLPRGSASAIAAFPVLSGIEAITVLGEVGDGGVNHRAAQSCAARWIEAWARRLNGRAASRWRSERRVARGGAMTVEFPPPDARLAGKVKVVQLSAQRDALRVASQNGSGTTAAFPEARTLSGKEVCQSNE